jgi:hypothetical protein
MLGHHEGVALAAEDLDHSLSLRVGNGCGYRWYVESPAGLVWGILLSSHGGCGNKDCIRAEMDSDVDIAQRSACFAAVLRRVFILSLYDATYRQS